MKCFAIKYLHPPDSENFLNSGVSSQSSEEFPEEIKSRCNFSLSKTFLGSFDGVRAVFEKVFLAF